MNLLKINLLIALTTIFTGCSGGADSPTSSAEFHIAAFDVLKSGDSGRISEIALTLDDYVAIEKGFESNKGLAESEIIAKSEKTEKFQKAKAAESIEKIHSKTQEFGFDWANATLAGVSQKQGDGKYDPKSTDKSIDVILEIKSGDKTIHVGIGDCIYVNGRRKTADGFRGVKLATAE